MGSGWHGPGEQAVPGLHPRHVGRHGHGPLPTIGPVAARSPPPHPMSGFDLDGLAHEWRPRAAAPALTPTPPRPPRRGGLPAPPRWFAAPNSRVCPSSAPRPTAELRRSPAVAPSRAAARRRSSLARGRRAGAVPLRAGGATVSLPASCSSWADPPVTLGARHGGTPCFRAGPTAHGSCLGPTARHEHVGGTAVARRTPARHGTTSCRARRRAGPGRAGPLAIYRLRMYRFSCDE